MRGHASSFHHVAPAEPATGREGDSGAGAGVWLAPAPSFSRPSLFHELRPAVVIVCSGAGRVEFNDSKRLFDFLAGLPDRRDEIIAIWAGQDACVSEAGVAALGAMIETVGFAPFSRACEARSGPERRWQTRWGWQYLADYLGWTWRTP